MWKEKLTELLTDEEDQRRRRPEALFEVSSFVDKAVLCILTAEIWSDHNSHFEKQPVFSKLNCGFDTFPKEWNPKDAKICQKETFLSLLRILHSTHVRLLAIICLHLVVFNSFESCSIKLILTNIIFQVHLTRNRAHQCFVPIWWQCSGPCSVYFRVSIVLLDSVNFLCKKKFFKDAC